MTDSLEFEYVVAEWYVSDGVPRPFLPVKLSFRGNVVQAWGLVDSGADMNLMPFQIGLDLGLSWERSAQDFELQGITGNSPAKAVAVDLEIGSWPKQKMAFAWSTLSETPVILGQWNFFQMVDVCFSRSLGQMRMELPK